MLYTQGNELTRIQCAFVDTPEVQKMAEYIGAQLGYSNAYLLPEYVEENSSSLDLDPSDRDELFREAAEVIVSSRNASKSRKAASLAGKVGRSGSLSEAKRVDVIINATPIGMRGAGNENQLPLPVEAMHKGQIIVDLIYHPLQTEFLKNASRIGAHTMNGIGMLIHQAALQYTLWTNKEAPLDVMQDAVIQQISK